jgi:hypothetical protein
MTYLLSTSSWPWLLLAGLAALVQVRAEDNNNNSSNNADPVDILGQFDGIGPFIVGLFLVIFTLHLVIQPNWALVDLLQVYQTEGITIPGIVLDCEVRRPGSQLYLVECMWECEEHQHADNPSLKFRFPDAYSTKRWVRRFEFPQELGIGVAIPIILPRGNIQPRSGCPTHVVEFLWDQEQAKVIRNRFVLGVGLVIICVLIGLAIPPIREMDNSNHGWVVLGLSMAVIEVVSMVVAGDQFLKRKGRVFDAAQPMVSAEVQEARKAAAAAAPRKTAPPFSVPMHEFAGHARVTLREH